MSKDVHKIVAVGQSICMCGKIRSGPEKSTRWGDVTCKECLRLRPHYKTRKKADEKKS